MKRKNVLAMMMALTLTFGMVALSGCKKDEKAALDNVVENMIVGENVGNGIQALSVLISPSEYETYNVSETVESAHLVTATYADKYVSDTAVDWTYEFVSAESGWASGKTVSDYVTVTPTSDGALTAVVECKQAFGEQIKVTCTSRQTPTISDSFTCDYKRFTRQVGIHLHANNEDFSFSDFKLGLMSTSVVGTNNVLDLNERDIVGQYDTSGFVDYAMTTGTLGSGVYSQQYSSVTLENEATYNSLIAESDVLSFDTSKDTRWYGYLGLPGIDRLKESQILSILYYWELNHDGDVSNESLAEYDDGGAAYYEYLRIMNELVALSGDQVRQTIRFDLKQVYKGDAVYMDLTFVVTDASEYFVSAPTSITLDTDNIVFEP